VIYQKIELNGVSQMFNTILVLAFSSVATISDGDMYEFSRGYPYDMSRCIMTELHEIFDYGDEQYWSYEANDESFKIVKKDGTWSVECKVNTRTEIDQSGVGFTLKHSEMDYGQE
jgi:hypothetical protein